MWWGLPEPIVTPLHYYCPEHDVYGRGFCWIEGCTAELQFGQNAPSWTHSHRHDPSKKSVSIGDGNVPIRRELRTLI